MLSQNGWTVLDPRHTHKWVIPDTQRHLILRHGPAGFLLAHLALWFHEVVEPLDRGTWDDWGYAVRPIRGIPTAISNHASGTAVDLNATAHPLGVRGTFPAGAAAVIRRRLGEVYDGAIRWGGDYQNRADEMHFEIVGEPSRVLALSDGLRNSPRGRRVLAANVGAVQ